MSKIKKAFLIFMVLIVVMLLVIINLDEIDEIHQLDYEKSGFRGLPFYSSTKVDLSTGIEMLYAFEGEIFPNDNISKPELVDEWMVDETIKQNVSIALRSEFKKIKREGISIFRYRVQIIGYTYNNQRYIWFNGFCWLHFNDYEDTWKAKYVRGVLGKRTCFFWGLYDVKTKKIVMFDWG